MKRCNACSRYAVGQPTYCPFCGRSYDVRICSRGHRNPRHVQFCPECGSHELSEPAPPEDVMVRVSRLGLKLVAVLVLSALVLAVPVAIISSLDRLAGPVIVLVLVYVLLHWTTTLLPAPIRKVTTAAGRRAMQAIKSRRQRR